MILEAHGYPCLPDSNGAVEAEMAWSLGWKPEFPGFDSAAVNDSRHRRNAQAQMHADIEPRFWGLFSEDWKDYKNNTTSLDRQNQEYERAVLDFNRCRSNRSKRTQKRIGGKLIAQSVPFPAGGWKTLQGKGFGGGKSVKMRRTD
jgi:hypothetical protein